METRRLLSWRNGIARSIWSSWTWPCRASTDSRSLEPYRAGPIASRLSRPQVSTRMPSRWPERWARTRRSASRPKVNRSRNATGSEPCAGSLATPRASSPRRPTRRTIQKASRSHRMKQKQATSLTDILNQHESEILNDWMTLQRGAATRRADLISDADLQRQSKDFLSAFRQGVASGRLDDIMTPAWEPAREIVVDFTRSRARMGFTPTETAVFVFSLKQPLFRALNTNGHAEEDLWNISTALDKLGLYTGEMYQKSREEVILQQQQELLELSTPVVKLWDGILALPLIGTLDSERTQVVMENLLQSIVESGAAIAIIDITGVPTVDTLVAQHLLKTVAAARLMGAECIISGIRPQIAATIVHLGVELNTVATKATLADAFALALKRTGQSIQRGRQN